MMPCRLVTDGFICGRGSITPRDRNIVEQFKEWLRLTKGNQTQLSYEEWRKRHNAPEQDDDCDYNTHPAWCPLCGKPHQIVRPGKTQPTCDCDQICPKHGPNKIIYHREGEVSENISGYFCADCWKECEKEHEAENEPADESGLKGMSDIISRRF